MAPILALPEEAKTSRHTAMLQKGWALWCCALKIWNMIDMELSVLFHHDTKFATHVDQKELNMINTDVRIAKKEREPPLRVLALVMTLSLDLPKQILNAQTKARKPENIKREDVGERVGEVAYKLELPEELSRVHNTFHVSNLKKCHADEPLAVPLDGLHLDNKLHFVEEPIEIVGREVKRMKQSRIPLVKVQWNSKRGPEFTWEREDQFKKKYPHLFTKTAPSSSAAS
ncbi:hypothetical protein Tco_1272303 [Tanacetum coccineum]